jgi:hypothetical protein
MQDYLGEMSLLLWAVWNPIGFDAPLNEYERYTPQLWRMLEEDASVEVIGAELKRICEQSMEIDGDTDSATAAAQTLKRWWYWRFEYPVELGSESK